MGKYNRVDTKPVRGRSPLTAAESTPSTPNHHGARGFARELKTELFMLGVANMAGQDTYYEKAADRDARYAQLIRQAIIVDPVWTGHFLKWLRNDANMRSASLVGALEAAKAMVDAKVSGARAIVSSVLQRADEPGEALAYWTSHYGKAIPKPIKRGIADAVTRLYTEYAVLKYDTDSKGFRFGDVINLVHPTPADADRGHLFGHILERRYGRDPRWGSEIHRARALPMLLLNDSLRTAIKNGQSLTDFDINTIKAAGVTWENALSMAGANADKRKLWEALIPSMGYMAKLRNLRNFDQAGLDDEAVELVARELVDPAAVAKSRQFPFRFYAAYLATKDSLRWSYALERALGLSLLNVPALSGRTLVLVDQSPSMFPEHMGWSYKSTRSDMTNADMAKLFGSAVALRAENADLVQHGGSSHAIPFRKGDAVLTTMQKFSMVPYTDTFAAVSRHYDKHDRIVIITDEENQTYHFRSIDEALSMASHGRRSPAEVPIYLWNLGGYRTSSIGSGRNRNSFAGMTDAAFGMIPIIEAARDAAWPWESGR